MRPGIVTLDEFLESKPDIELLRKVHPALAKYLQGEFADKVTFYEESKVRSWKLSTGPTWGMFPVGYDFDFPTEANVEKLIVVDGKFKTTNPVEIIEGNYPQIIAEHVLHLDVYEALTYLCLYIPKEKPQK